MIYESINLRVNFEDIKREMCTPLIYPRLNIIYLGVSVESSVVVL